MKKTPVSTLRMHCLRLAGREHGLATSEVTGYSATQVRAAVWHLKNDGVLFAARLSHKVVRYFDSQKKAHAYERHHGTGSGAASQADGRKLSMAPKASQRAWWPADAPAVITSKTKITIAPPPPDWTTRSNTHSRWG